MMPMPTKRFVYLKVKYDNQEKYHPFIKERSQEIFKVLKFYTESIFLDTFIWPFDKVWFTGMDIIVVCPSG